MKTWQYVNDGKMPPRNTAVVAAVRIHEIDIAGDVSYWDEITEAFYEDGRWYTRSENGDPSLLDENSEVYAWHKFEQPPEYR